MQITNNINSVSNLIQGETVNVGGVSISSQSSPQDFFAAVVGLRQDVERLELPGQTKAAVLEQLRNVEQSPHDAITVQGRLDRAKEALTSVSGSVEAVGSIANKLLGLAHLAATIF